MFAAARRASLFAWVSEIRRMSLGVKVALLEVCGSQVRLDVAQARNRLDDDPATPDGEHHIRCPQVAGDRNGHLQADLPARMKAPMKAANQRNLPGVADRRNEGIEIDASGKTDHRAPASEHGQGKIPGRALLRATDPGS